MVKGSLRYDKIRVRIEPDVKGMVLHVEFIYKDDVLFVMSQNELNKGDSFAIGNISGSVPFTLE